MQQQQKPLSKFLNRLHLIDLSNSCIFLSFFFCTVCVYFFVNYYTSCIILPSLPPSTLFCLFSIFHLLLFFLSLLNLLYKLSLSLSLEQTLVKSSDISLFHLPCHLFTHVHNCSRFCTNYTHTPSIFPAETPDFFQPKKETSKFRSFFYHYQIEHNSNLFPSSTKFLLQLVS